jgi:uncharacterized integral membrane protein
MDLGSEHPTPPPEHERLRRRPKREQLRVLVVALLTALATAFALLNLNHVKVNFIVATRHPPLIVVIVICLVVGFLIGAITARQRGARRR